MTLKKLKKFFCFFKIFKHLIYLKRNLRRYLLLVELLKSVIWLDWNCCMEIATVAADDEWWRWSWYDNDSDNGRWSLLISDKDDERIVFFVL